MSGTGAPHSTLLQSLDVLLVEDDAIIAMMVEEVLADLGAASVRHAGRIAEAFALLAARNPHVAVIDVNLSGSTGFELAERLEGAGIPFVFTTGYTRDEIPARWRGRPYVPKPIESAVLAQALEAALTPV
jgi:CheY-like chemotaxis protein